MNERRLGEIEEMIMATEMEESTRLPLIELVMAAGESTRTIENMMTERNYMQMKVAEYSNQAIAEHRRAEFAMNGYLKLLRAARALESEASKRLRFRDNGRYPELCAALANLRAEISSANGLS